MTHEEMLECATPVDNTAPANQLTVQVELVDGSKPEDCVRWFNAETKEWVYQAVIDEQVYILKECEDGKYKPV